MRFLAAIFAFLCLIAPATAAPSFPALTGRVVDDAHILNDATKADLTEKLAALEQKTSRQLVVVTIPSLGGYEISDYGYQLGRAWGIGQKKLNNGALFIVAPTEHKTRIEVGYGLEPVLTDALSSNIIQTEVLPKFRAGDFNAGVFAGTNAIIAQLSLDESTAEQKAADADRAQVNADLDDSPPWWVIGLVLLGLVIFCHFFGGWWLIPYLLINTLGGRGGGGGGGWSSGGGGGGFSGSGGSFGGGGSSGSW